MVQTSKPFAECFQISCAADKKSFLVKMPGLMFEKRCTSARETLSIQNYSVEVHCADPAVVCNPATPCPGDCSSK